MKKLIFSLVLLFSFSFNLYATSLSLNEKSNDTNKVTITITKDEDIFWNSEKSNLNDLLKKTKLSLEKNQSLIVDLRCDANVRYQAVANVLSIFLSQKNKNIKINFVFEE